MLRIKNNEITLSKGDAAAIAALFERYGANQS